MNEFCYGVAILIGLLMLLMIWGTPDGPFIRNRMPPKHPPGYGNRKRNRK